MPRAGAIRGDVRAVVENRQVKLALLNLAEVAANTIDSERFGCECLSEDIAHFEAELIDRLESAVLDVEAGLA